MYAQLLQGILTFNDLTVHDLYSTSPDSVLLRIQPCNFGLIQKHLKSSEYFLFLNCECNRYLFMTLSDLQTA